MSAAADGSQPANPWPLAMTVSLVAFMEVLDSTVANVIVRHISGGLSAAPRADGVWILTSYIVANAIVLPLSGWLSDLLGRRNFFLSSVILFTVASVLCALAQSLPQLVAFRILQGLSGGGLQPVAMAILLDLFPPRRHGTAMSLYSVVLLLAPMLGPIIGGWLADNVSWRCAFFINLPIGLLVMLVAYWQLRDPPYLVASQNAMRGRSIDWLGLAGLALGLGCLEILLDKGQEWDWLGDPWHRVHGLIVLIALGLSVNVIRSLCVTTPVVQYRLLGNRNFLIASLTATLIFGIIYGALSILPTMLQTLMGYDATQAGLVVAPAGLFALLVMPLVGFVLGQGLDARCVIALGVCLLSFGSWRMSQINLGISHEQILWPRVILIVGANIALTALNVAAFMYIPRESRGYASALFGMLRTEGASIGVAMSETVVTRREQVHSARLGEWIDPASPTTATLMERMIEWFAQKHGDLDLAQTQTWLWLNEQRQQQASILSFLDVHWLYCMLALVVLPLVFLMRRSVVVKGQHVAAE